MWLLRNARWLVWSVGGAGLRRRSRWHAAGRSAATALRFVPQRHEVELAIAPQLAPLAGALVQRTRHALDLDADRS
jgi:hypothetical protein